MTSINSQFHKLLSSIHNPGCCKTDKEQTVIVCLIDFKNAAINIHLRQKLTSSRPLSSQQKSC
ncbi:hypothetical protein Peur_045200 [Populus x canadensis]